MPYELPIGQPFKASTVSQKQSDKVVKLAVPAAANALWAGTSIARRQV